MAVTDRVRPNTGTAGGVRSVTRAAIPARTLRRDRWWLQPLITFVVLVAFVIYATWAAFQNANYFADPYLSPFYSPCLTTSCAETGAPSIGLVAWAISPALLILIFPLGFRMTCYYYRKAYYRAFWLSPPACAVAEPHKRYTGETRFPLIIQNVHRYFFYAGLVFNVILTWDALLALRFDGKWGFGVGTAIMFLNATLLWLYSLSCHSCRHTVGGRINNFSRHPLRYKMWTLVSRLNTQHMQMAWASLIVVASTDAYIRLVATGTITDFHVTL